MTTSTGVPSASTSRVPTAGRVNQKARTRAAIVRAVQDLARDGAEITMPSVARAALVSEATAYRYFPDLASLLREALEGTWPEPAEAMRPVAGSADPVERIGFATEFMLREVLARQGAVRAMISASTLHPEVTGKARPGHRFGLIDHALAPLDQAPDVIAPAVLAQLKQDLAIIVSAEALFVFTDMCGFSPDEAVERTARIARTVTAAAIRGVAAE